MKKFYIITNKAKDADYSFTKEIEQYLQKKGAVCLSSNQEQTGGDTDYRYTDARQIPTDTECIIVLGGDGTLQCTAVTRQRTLKSWRFATQRHACGTTVLTGRRST